MGRGSIKLNTEALTIVRFTLLRNGRFEYLKMPFAGLASL